MSQVFNLKQALNQIKEAMGEHYVYQPAKSWWRLDEIDAGSPSWKEWVDGNIDKGLKSNKSMLSALNEIRRWHYQKKLLFRARYGIDDKEVNNIFQVFVGYDPMRGIHMLSIGPYFARADAINLTFAKCAETKTDMNDPEALLKLAESIQVPEGLKGDKLSKDPQYITKRAILSVRSDRLNKFAFFTRRFGKMSEGDISKAIQGQLKAVLDNFGVALSADDFDFQLKQLPQSQVGVGLLSDPDFKDSQSGERQNAEWESSYMVADPNSPDMKAYFMQNPVMGTGSNISLGQRGFDKIIQDVATKGNWADIYAEVLDGIAKSRGVGIEEIKKQIGAAGGSLITQMLVPRLRKIKDSLKVKGDPRADFITIPDFKIRALAPERKGQQLPSTLRITKAQKSIIDYKFDILTSIRDAHTSNPEKLAVFMNAARKKFRTRATAEITPEILAPWLDQLKSEATVIKKGKVIRVKSWATMLKEAQQSAVALDKNVELRDVGFDQLIDAYKMASIAFLETKEEYIDKKTKVKLNLVEPPNMFEKEGEEIKTDSATLNSLRSESLAQHGDEKAYKAALQAEILKEIGDVNEGNKVLTEEPPEVQPGEEGSPVEVQDVPEPAMQDAADAADVSTDTPLAPEEKTTPDELPFEVTEVPDIAQQKTDIPGTPAPLEPTVSPTASPESVEPVQEVAPKGKSKFKKPKFDFGKLVGNTVQSLIRLARDLDEQGKCKSAEEIHQIIRKYQSRL